MFLPKRYTREINKNYVWMNAKGIYGMEGLWNVCRIMKFNKSRLNRIFLYKMNVNHSCKYYW